MRTMGFLLCCGLGFGAWPVGAAVQTDDVVVMRRVIAAPTRRPSAPAPVASPAPAATPTPIAAPTPVTPAPVPAARWVYGDWSFATADTCSPAAPQTRTAVCTSGDTTVADERCGAREGVERLVQRLDGCGFMWSAGVWGEYTSACAALATRSRAIACQAFRRGYDFVVDDARCEASGPRPPETDLPAVEVRAGCAYGYTYGDWSAPSSTCSNHATSARVATCRRYVNELARSGQPLTGEAVGSSLCVSAGLTAEVARTQADYGSCGNAITNGDFAAALAPWTGAGTWFSAGQVRMWTIDGSLSQAVTGLDVGSTYVLVGYMHNGSSTAAQGFAEVTLTSSDGVVERHSLVAANGGVRRQVTTSFTARTPTAVLGITNRNRSGGQALLTLSAGWSLVLVR